MNVQWLQLASDDIKVSLLGSSITLVGGRRSWSLKISGCCCCTVVGSYHRKRWYILERLYTEWAAYVLRVVWVPYRTVGTRTAFLCNRGCFLTDCGVGTCVGRLVFGLLVVKGEVLPHLS